MSVIDFDYLPFDLQVEFDLSTSTISLLTDRSKSCRDCGLILANWQQNKPTLRHIIVWSERDTDRLHPVLASVHDLMQHLDAEKERYDVGF